MRINSEQDLNTRIKAGNLGGLWLLTGSEEFLKKKYARLLLDKAVVKSARGFDAIAVEAQSPNPATLSEDIYIFPCLGEYRSITMTDFDVDKINKDDLTSLLTLLSDIPSSTQLILVAAETADSKRSSKWKKLMDLAAEKGVCVELSARSRGDLVRFIQSCLKPFHSEIESDAAYRLISLCGSDMTILENESAKLGAYATNRTVTQKDIDELVTISLEASSFDMIKLLLRGDYPAAFGKLTVLLEQNTDPILVVAAIASVYTDLYKAAAAIESGMSLSQAVKDFGYTGADFKLKNAWNEALRTTSARIGSALQLISDADLKLKSSALPPDLVLVTLLTDLAKGIAA